MEINGSSCLHVRDFDFHTLDPNRAPPSTYKHFQPCQRREKNTKLFEMRMWRRGVLNSYNIIKKENLRLRKELEEAKKENLFLKKAAAFFAKEIDQRLIDLLNNIIMNLVCAGSCAALISVQMLTTTTENTGRRIIMPAERKYCQKWCTDFTYFFWKTMKYVTTVQSQICMIEVLSPV